MTVALHLGFLCYLLSVHDLLPEGPRFSAIHYNNKTIQKKTKQKQTHNLQIAELSFRFHSVSPSVNLRGETSETTKNPVGTAASTALTTSGGH